MTATAPVTGQSLATHPFLRGIRAGHLALLAEAATITTVPARHRLFEEGGYAHAFWLIRAGQVAVDLHVPGRGRMIVEMLGRGEVVGWSWLFPPHLWQFGAVAIQPVEAFVINGAAVRARCGEHPDLGLELTRRFSHVLAGRLRAARLRLADQGVHPDMLALLPAAGSEGEHRTAGPAPPAFAPQDAARTSQAGGTTAPAPVPPR